MYKVLKFFVAHFLNLKKKRQKNYEFSFVNICIHK
jgi:hypothetical protein